MSPGRGRNLVMLAVRRARRGDDEAIYRVHTAAIRELCKDHYTREEIDAWAGRLYVGAHRLAIDKRDFFVADLDARIVGFGQLDRSTAEIEAIYVDPTVGRRGVGSVLLQEVEECARAAALPSLHLDASLNSVPFYEKAGFRQLRAALHTVAPGTDIACVAMEKQVAP